MSGSDGPRGEGKEHLLRRKKWDPGIPREMLPAGTPPTAKWVSSFLADSTQKKRADSTRKSLCRICENQSA